MEMEENIKWFMLLVVLIAVGIATVQYSSSANHEIYYNDSYPGAQNFTSTLSNTSLSDTGNTFTSFSATGYNNSYLFFDGVDDILNNSNAFSSWTQEQNHSFSLWFNSKAPTLNTATSQTLLSSGYSYVYIRYFNATHDQTLFRISNATAAVSAACVVPANQTDVWHNFAGNYWVDESNISNVATYLDGVPCSFNGSRSGSLTNKANDLIIGSRTGVFYKGYIEEVRVYNRTLTNDEVTSIYNSGMISNSSLPSDNLYAWYSFNENSGTTAYDKSGNNLPTVASGTAMPSWARQGYFHGTFDGVDDGLNASYSQGMNTSSSNALSVCAWANSRTNTYASSGRVVARWVTGGNKRVWSIYHGATNQKYSFQTGNLTGGTANSPSVTANVTSSINSWTYICGIYNGSNVLIYLDGTLKGISSGTQASLYDTDAYLTIGNLEGSGDFFNGSIDEVRIYNRSLNASEIAGVYSYGRTKIGSAPDTTGLVVYYDFDDWFTSDKASTNHLTLNGVNRSDFFVVDQEKTVSLTSGTDYNIYNGGTFEPLANSKARYIFSVWTRINNSGVQYEGVSILLPITAAIIIIVGIVFVINKMKEEEE